MRALGKPQTSDSEETALGKMGEKPEVTGDITLSLSDIPASAGKGQGLCLLYPSVTKPWGQEAEHISWYRPRGCADKDNSGAVTGSPGGSCCGFLWPVRESSLSPTFSSGQTRTFPCTPHALQSVCPLSPSTYSSRPPLSDITPQPQIKSCLCQFLSK